MKLAAFAMAAAFFLSTDAFAQPSSDDSVRDRFQEGHLSRQKHAYEDAERSYRRALDYGLHLNNPEIEYQAYFYLGLTKQEAADDAAANDADRARTLREEAQEYYKKAHSLQPRSTATLLNLAEVAFDNRDRDEAEKWLVRGLGLDDKRAAQFAEKLGDLKADAKDPKEALKSYRLALKKKNASTSIPHKYFRQLLLAAKDPNDKYATEAVDQLWGLAQQGEIDPAIDGAFAAVESGPAFAGESAVELLNVVARALAAKEYDAATFRASNTAASLRKLLTNEVLAPRVAVLFWLYDGTASPEQAAAWRTPGDYDRPPERPSGIESLQNITRGLGYSAQRTRDYARAESAYNLALRLDPQRLDPGTLRDLATVYYAQGKLAALEALLREFEEKLYTAKSAAYERVDWEEVYEYHRTVGTLYLWLNRYDDAKVQFDLAYNAAKRRGIPIDPDLRLARAQAYFALGARADAMRDRLQAAEQYVLDGDLIRARGAVSRVSPEDAESDEDARRYRAVLDRTVTIVEPLEHLYDVKSALAVLSTDPEKPVRIQVEKLLAQWGVTNIRIQDEHGTFAYAKRTVPFEFPAEPHP
jgi:tetratricopeptide (TPR) repeat protein